MNEKISKNNTVFPVPCATREKSQGIWNNEMKPGHTKKICSHYFSKDNYHVCVVGVVYVRAGPGRNQRS